VESKTYCDAISSGSRKTEMRSLELTRQLLRLQKELRFVNYQMPVAQGTYHVPHAPFAPEPLLAACESRKDARDRRFATSACPRRTRSGR
jgi:hypothetical protein